MKLKILNGSNFKSESVFLVSVLKCSYFFILLRPEATSRSYHKHDSHYQENDISIKSWHEWRRQTNAAVKTKVFCDIRREHSASANFKSKENEGRFLHILYKFCQSRNCFWTLIYQFCETASRTDRRCLKKKS